MKRIGPGLRRALGCVVLLTLVLAGLAPAQTDDDRARQRLLELRAEIARHDDLYFRQAKPEISDAAYDALKRELRALEEAHPEMPADAPTLGDDRSGRFPTHRHRVRMLSLDKAYNEAEWRGFHARLRQALGTNEATFVVEPKYDGLAVSLTYAHGRLVRAVTRGNGEEGDDVSANLPAVAGVPSILGDGEPWPTWVELRGEVFVTDEEFARLNAARAAAGEEPFAHPRNLAAGTLKATEATDRAERRLSLVIHGWGAWEGRAPPVSQRAFHDTMRAWGLPAVERVRVAHSADEVWAAVQALERERDRLGFPIDGAVVKLDDVELRRVAGEGETAPRWAIACKFAPERALTRLRAITWQVGRTGVLTPVAELEPVSVGGATVARATLHNREMIRRLDLRIGDVVEVERAGEVIPALAGVRRERRPAEARPYELPTHCPACETAVEAKPGEAALRCPNTRCPAQRQRRLEHFVSSQAVDLDGFGPATLAALSGAGVVQGPADFYRLTREDLVRTGAVGAKTADRLLADIARSRQAELWRFIHGFGIPQVGAATARRLASLSGDLAGFAALDVTRLTSELGPAVAESVGAFLARPEVQADLQAMMAAGVRPTVPAAARPRTELRGRVFVFTGALPGVSRAKATEWVENAGGVVREGVSAQTDYVVAGDNPGAKLAEARQLGVKVLTPQSSRPSSPCPESRTSRTPLR